MAKDRAGSYKVSVGNTARRVETFQEAGAFVAEAVTSLAAQDPEGAAEGAMMANRAFSVGTVQHALDTHGSWRTIITVRGEAVPVVVVKEQG
jgi:hypothetical protein